MSEPNKVHDSRAIIDSYSKIAAVAIGLLYVIGFLVVATHLSRFGVSGFSVLQLQYLMAGVWALGPPVVFAGVMLPARKLEERAAPEVAEKFNWRRGLISSVLTGLPLAGWAVLVASIPASWEGFSWKLAIGLYVFLIAIVNCAQVLWMSWRVEGKGQAWFLNRRDAAPFYLILLITVVLVYVVWFAVRIYPLIPFSLGGGRPLTVAFIEGEKKLPNGIEADSSLNRSVPYPLLLETEKSYVVISLQPGEKSIEVSKDSVAGMVVLKESREP
jgi:hypothetical protein